MCNKAVTISDRRSQYPLHERLIVYDSEFMQRMFDHKHEAPPPPQPSSYTIHGVNLLNKSSLDSDTVMNRIIQRRQTHNRVERRRRDRMNQLFSQLSSSLPRKHEKNRTDILQEAIEYIRLIQAENRRLKQDSLALDDDLAFVTNYSSSGNESSESSSPSYKVPVVSTRMKSPLYQYESVLSFN